MTDILRQVTDTLLQQEAQFMTWTPPLILLIVALLLSYASIKNWLQELILYRSIRKSGMAALRNIVISDGMDGRVLIENIVLTPGGIYILPVKRYCGIIFAAENMETWTQVIGNRSYKFSNPLPELEAYIMAVRNLLPDIGVSGYILVTHDAEFPKGKPERVVPVVELASRMGDSQGEITAQLKNAWEKLQAVRLELNPEEKKTLRHTDNSSGYVSQLVISTSLVCAAIAWLSWRFYSSL